MHGDASVIEQLNLALSVELTAIAQYMTQSEMCQNWGYTGLAARTKQRAIEEMHHAEGLINHLRKQLNLTAEDRPGAPNRLNRFACLISSS
jgi:bacterioferritin